jgi:hypothetical protein
MILPLREEAQSLTAVEQALAAFGLSEATAARRRSADLAVDNARLTTECGTLNELLQGDLGAQYKALSPLARRTADEVIVPIVLSKLERGADHACRAWSQVKFILPEKQRAGIGTRGALWAVTCPVLLQTEVWSGRVVQ